MLIPLPKDAIARKRALDWLNAQGIRHLRLFEVVEMQSGPEADRFKRWLEDNS